MYPLTIGGVRTYQQIEIIRDHRRNAVEIGVRPGYCRGYQRSHHQSNQSHGQLCLDEVGHDVVRCRDHVRWQRNAGQLKERPEDRAKRHEQQPNGQAGDGTKEGAEFRLPVGLRDEILLHDVLIQCVSLHSPDATDHNEEPDIARHPTEAGVAEPKLAPVPGSLEHRGWTS